MADKRKLNAEIDRCLKKVSEGGEVFEEIWEKVQQTNNANQKEKLEMDLKKEIKKLQRLRDQIKTWSVSGEVKDKEPLLEARKSIEAQMEKFKVIERETKTKAYSKEGLTNAGKVDPHEKQKDEVLSWVSNAISSFNQQYEKAESDAESLRGKKKLDKEDHSNLETCEEMMKRHKLHLNKLESILRKVDNDAIELEQVSLLRETVEYFVETPDDVGDEDIYADLDLEDTTTPSTIEPDIDQSYASALSNHSTNHTSHQSSVISAHHKSREEEKRKHRTYEELTSSSKYVSTPKTPVFTSIASNRVSATPTRPTTNISNGNSSHPPIKTLGTPSSLGLGYAQVVSSQHSANSQSGKSTAGKVNATVSNGLSNLPSHLSAANNEISAEASLENKKENHLTSSNSSSGAFRVLFPASSTETFPTKTSNTTSETFETSTSTSFSYLSNSYNQQYLPNFANNHQKQLFQQQQQQQQLLSSQVYQHQKNQHFVGTSQTTTSQQILISQSQPWQSTDDKSKLPQRLLNGYTTNTFNKDAYFMQVSSAEMLSNSNNLTTSTTTTTSAADDAYFDSQKNQTDSPCLIQQQQYSLGTNSITSNSNTQMNYSTRNIRIENIFGLTPLGPLPLSTGHLSKSSMLESASQHIPLTCDSEKIRVYLPSNPCAMPAHYPRGLNPNLNLDDMFNRLDPETLFFAFYYLEGTKAQFLAAKALKQKSWRFHTKYLVWFQRHEKPKTINEEFEQGTYIFFDYEQWSQRKKELFKFEYKYLEDQDLN